MSEAIILAGGLGTRLRSVVSDLPKPMASLGSKPFLEYILHYLKRNGVDRAILSVGYNWETIRDYFGDYFDGIELVYSVENEPLGTGGAIKKAIELVHADEVFIINGDTFFDIDLNSLHLENDSRLILSLKQMREFDRYGCVEFDDNGLVIAFTEKGYKECGDINGGIYLASRNIFDEFVLEDKFSFEEFMQSNFQKLKITSKVFDNYFIDIGIPEDYARAQNELKDHV